MQQVGSDEVAGRRDGVGGSGRSEGPDPFPWDELTPVDEPSRHRAFWWLGAGLVVLGTPWWQPPALAGRLVFGLPFWVVCSLACAAGLACLISFASLRWWSDGEPGRAPEHAAEGAMSDEAPRGGEAGR